MLTSGCVSILLTAMLGWPPPATADVGPVAFKLQDFRGAWHRLEDVRESKAVVVAFLGVDCPMASLYAPRLAELARTYESKGVAFFGIDANQQDAPSALSRFAQEHDLPFPFLKDVGNELADRLGVDRTPEVFVLDSGRVVRYRGRVDDQYRLRGPSPGPDPSRPDHCARRTARGPAGGHAEDRGRRLPDRPDRQGQGPVGVTYSRQVARILRDRCVACHREGEIAPFSLATYAQAAGWAETIDEVVQGGRMPPWHASPEYGSFSNEARLTAEEKRTIAAWVAGGAPEGDPNDRPEPAHYVEGWRIPAPDLVIALPRTVKIPAEGTMPYQNFLVDLKLKKDVWVKASQVRRGIPSVVHHLVVFVLPPGSRDRGQDRFPGGLRAGMPPRILPEGTARLVPAGSRLMFQVHYTPRGMRRRIAARSAWSSPTPRRSARR